MDSLGAQSYTDTLSKAKVATGGQDLKVLHRVGRRISKVANKPNYKWEYALIQEPTVNAWCMPGGKIGFYSGILPTLQHESGMAFVMGHEVGHAIAHHGAERMTQQLGVQGGLLAFQLWAEGKGKLTTEQKSLLYGALGMGAQLGILLPFSRMHESEADVIGMMYMAGAGYPPAESMKVWTRMEALGGARPPEFLSTHPSPDHRKKHLKSWLPQALKKYKRHKLSENVTKTLWTAQ